VVPMRSAGSSKAASGSSSAGGVGIIDGVSAQKSPA
jgi:hypothetical protein